MLSIRATRNITPITRQASKCLIRQISSLKNSHSSGTNDKYISKVTNYQNSSFNLRLSYLKISNFNTNFSTTAFNERHRAASFMTDAEKIPFSSSKCIYAEHPDVADRSEDEIEEFRQLKRMTIKGTDVPKPIYKFSELSLPENLLNVLYNENYPEPTPIQSQGWPVALSCRDMVGVSQTGSGKTLAYMLPAIVHATNQRSSNFERSNNRSPHTPKVLVLGPTRELVQQIHSVSKHFMKASMLRGACVYGGSSKSNQLNQLEGAEICIATPGRLLDFLQNRQVSLKNCSYLVLDEADRMLDMGFEPQIRDIVDQIPCQRQTLMWSATWPREIQNLAEDFLTDYIHITIGSTELVANPNIQQNVYVMNEEEKLNRLYSLLTSILESEQSKVLVFAETKRKVDYISNLLNSKRIEAWGIHGDCSQYQRDQVLRHFRMTTPSVLIATDIASRGLDISDIHHVVNFDFPTNIEDYIHRIGRTARGSACGEAHSFFTSANSHVLKDLLSVLKQSNQSIDPELYKLAETSVFKSNFKPQYKRSYGSKNSFYNKSGSKSRMYSRNKSFIY